MLHNNFVAEELVYKVKCCRQIYAGAMENTACVTEVLSKRVSS
jgi:hypothetical protein